MKFNMEKVMLFIGLKPRAKRETPEQAKMRQAIDAAVSAQSASAERLTEKLKSLGGLDEFTGLLDKRKAH